MSEIKPASISEMIAKVYQQRDEARDLACRLTEEVIEYRKNTTRPAEDSVRLDQVATILNRYLGEYRADQVPPPSLLRALAIAERRGLTWTRG